MVPAHFVPELWKPWHIKEILKTQQKLFGALFCCNQMWFLFETAKMHNNIIEVCKTSVSILIDILLLNETINLLS